MDNLNILNISEEKVIDLEEQFEIKTDCGQDGFAIVNLIEDIKTFEKQLLK